MAFCSISFLLVGVVACVAPGESSCLTMRADLPFMSHTFKLWRHEITSHRRTIAVFVQSGLAVPTIQTRSGIILQLISFQVKEGQEDLPETLLITEARFHFRSFMKSFECCDITSAMLICCFFLLPVWEKLVKRLLQITGRACMILYGTTNANRQCC